MAAAAAASGPVFLTSARAAALVGKVVLGVPALPRCMATPLRAAAVTTHATRAHMLIIRGRLPCGETYVAIDQDSRLLLEELRRTSTSQRDEGGFAARFDMIIKNSRPIFCLEISSSNISIIKVF